NFMDLQTEIAKYEIEEKSLRKISGIVLKQRVSKAQRLSNWSAQTLTAQQIEYAATDAYITREIYMEFLKNPCIKATSI
ncbi:MAG: 3'-5' exonuclease domain-containing protein 2, partial [Rikenellaceae bacterium]